MDSGGVRTLQQKMPTTFSEHTVRHRQRKPRTRLCPKEVPRLPRAQIHKQSYYSRAREVTGTPTGQGTGRERKGCPRLPFELLEGSEQQKQKQKGKGPSGSYKDDYLNGFVLASSESTLAWLILYKRAAVRI